MVAQPPIPYLQGWHDTASPNHRHDVGHVATAVRSIQEFRKRKDCELRSSHKLGALSGAKEFTSDMPVGTADRTYVAQSIREFWGHPAGHGGAEVTEGISMGYRSEG